MTSHLHKMISKFGSNDALQIHEIGHVSLNLPGGLNFDKQNRMINNSAGYDGGTIHEIQSYDRQDAFSGQKPRLRKTYKERFEELAVMKDHNGDLVYKEINAEWIKQHGQNKIKNGK